MTNYVSKEHVHCSLVFFMNHPCSIYCKTRALNICVNFSRFLSNVLLVIFINIKCQWDLMMGISPVFNFDVVMTRKLPPLNSCSREQRKLIWCIQFR